MSRTKIDIGRDTLLDLYHSKGLSPQKIGKLYNCSWTTVVNRIKDLGISKKNPSIARMRYEKLDFCGSDIEKAYMIGFRIGDLNCFLNNSFSFLFPKNKNAWLWIKEPAS